MLAASITYEPSETEIHRTIQQLRSCGTVWSIFDNSVTQPARARVRALCRELDISYFGTGKNVGTGAGLNALVSYADSQNQKWMVYLDQDTVLGTDYGPLLASSIAWMSHQAFNIAIVGSGAGRRITSRVSGAVPPRYEVAKFVIASGMLLNIAAVRSLGGFDEDMFLDTVDHEMCLRARRAGFVVLRDTCRWIHQPIGEDSLMINVKHRFQISRHPLWRRELMWRNSAILVARYARAFPSDCGRHLVIRLADTLLGALRYREPRYLSAAARGLRSGMRSGAGTAPEMSAWPRPETDFARSN